MNLFGMLEVSGSALGAERWRSEVVAANMANAETTHTSEGGPYRRQMLVFRAQPMPRFPMLLASLRKGAPDGGVRVERVVADTSPSPRHFEPGHPDAAEQRAGLERREEQKAERQRGPRADERSLLGQERPRRRDEHDEDGQQQPGADHVRRASVNPVARSRRRTRLLTITRLLSAIRMPAVR